MRTTMLAAALLASSMTFGERMGGAPPWGYEDPPPVPNGYGPGNAYVLPGSGKKHQRKAKAKIAKASKKRNRSK